MTVGIRTKAADFLEQGRNPLLVEQAVELDILAAEDTLVGLVVDYMELDNSSRSRDTNSVGTSLDTPAQAERKNTQVDMLVEQAVQNKSVERDNW